MADTHPKHERISFIVPEGNRALYREVAALRGMSLVHWYRKALREAVRDTLAEHELKRRMPRLHPPKPKRLQPRIKVTQAHPPPIEDET